ncbi:hypothetical protein C4F50_10525 [Flavobacterium sp. KB82]|uniref:LPXTG cell wall anchor domain-containing protein n=1 Tax=Flavobacterium hungaricum TaxID=2082725 RepID=A0ABR9TK49_9FLAO|nr:hypothetical protein [Flavobacterium hungaricum]
MEKNKKIKILAFSLGLSIFWSIYLLYKRRGEYFTNNDYSTISLICIFVIGLFFYFIKKWNNKE